MCKKLIIVMLACLLIFVGTACGDSSDTGSAIETPEASETEVVEQNKSETMVTPDFKAAMDSYEEFFDDYVEFMKKYQESDDVMGMMSDFADYMTKYSELIEKIDAIDEDSLSAADLAYYTEVTGRIMKKLSEVS